MKNLLCLLFLACGLSAFAQPHSVPFYNGSGGGGTTFASNVVGLIPAFIGATISTNGAGSTLTNAGGFYVGSGTNSIYGTPDGYETFNGSALSNLTLNIVVVSNLNASIFLFTNSAALPAGPMTNNFAKGGTQAVIQVYEDLANASGDSTNAHALIYGTTGGKADPAGYLGETNYAGILDTGSTVNLTTAKSINVMSLSLSAGDWDVSGHANYYLNAATANQFAAGISTTTGVMPDTAHIVYSDSTGTTLTRTNSLTIEPIEINVSSATTVYLVTQVTFSAGAIHAYGILHARRVH